MRILWINSEGFKFVNDEYYFVTSWDEITVIFYNQATKSLVIERNKEVYEDSCDIEQYFELKKYYKNYKIMSLVKELRKTDPVSILDHLVSNAKEIIDLEENLNPDKIL